MRLKNFKITKGGSDQKLVWFGQPSSNQDETAAWRKGTPMKDGTTRYVTHQWRTRVRLVKDDRLSAPRPLISKRTMGSSWISRREVPVFTGAARDGQPARALHKMPGTPKEASSIR